MPAGLPVDYGVLMEGCALVGLATCEGLARNHGCRS